MIGFRALTGWLAFTGLILLLVSCGDKSSDSREGDGLTDCSNAEAFLAVSPSIVRLTTEEAEGTGFIIGQDRVLTNDHVVEAASRLTAELSDGTEAEATVIGRNRERDLALLAVGTDELRSLKLASSQDLLPGSPVLVVGFALGLRGDPTISEGILSARRNVDGLDFLQVSAAVNPGNSGGPLIDQCGRVVGVASARFSEAEGLGLAIPGEEAATVLAKLVDPDEGDGSGDDSGDDGGNGDDGGDASPELEAYFADIEALFEDADADTDELSTLFDAALAEAATLEEEKEALMAFIFDNVSVLNNALDDMEDIDAPSETEDEHDAFIEAGRDLIALSSDFADQLDQAETEEEIDAVNVQFDEEGTALAAAADEACTGLQTIADDFNILVDLNCED